ncbi:Serine/threonine-protein kinase DCLK2 (CaMK-like CREB regulatory kinase 2) (CL2) (CLICK-II) (CLICK2) (Doublecortin-like and CAM kinase-like 2) (Doublecortin-like kinase 2) [Durusdinium trenchii]|uniref:Serine/threonine-protein kinase DCLK2 (CaMK-like CREB regulatory kinase 2) (CL2) (CLICK-II) (CLICK2) (Doublecortin-like and CAM kinase-like 2) (Doublecortin-like kinase 2) n=1 Tax=Durusdinium trenchii TaxID=1381693 RepID=A0ABP0HPU1_9DINO
MNFVRNLLTRSSKCMENQETEEEGRASYIRPSTTRSSTKSSRGSPASPESKPPPLFGVLRCNSGNSSTAEPSSESEDEALHLYGDVCQDVMMCVAKVGDTRRWREDRFEKVRLLQNAARNQGRVELMKELSSGRFVAVKRMPISWTGYNHKDFVKRHEHELEMPWVDVAIVKYLSMQRVQFVCDPIGTFRDESETFFVSTCADKGDLFEWSQTGPLPGLERENFLRPLVRQLCDAIRCLHSLDIAHCDLSLENILLMTTGDGSLQVKLIDFGMAAVKQSTLVGARGKPSYQAPEMHVEAYDPMVSDAFALGVVIFGMVAQDYPWLSTKPGGCKCFQFASKQGLRAYLQKRKARNCNGARLAEVFSASMVDFLESLLQFQPQDRTRLLGGRFPWLATPLEPVRTREL